MSALARDSERKFALEPSSFIMALHRVPWLIVGYDELRRHPLAPRHGFLLSLVDGRCTVEMIVDMSGLERGEAIALLAELVRRGVLELKDAR